MYSSCTFLFDNYNNNNNNELIIFSRDTEKKIWVFFFKLLEKWVRHNGTNDQFFNVNFGTREKMLLMMKLKIIKNRFSDMQIREKTGAGWISMYTTTTTTYGYVYFGRENNYLKKMGGEITKIIELNLFLQRGKING